MPTTPPLPPRGIFVPTYIIFHSELPAAVLVSWIKLRCLAWDGWSTTPMTLPELASHLGIHPARLSKHLAHLGDISAIEVHQARHEKVVLTFPEEPAVLHIQYPVRQRLSRPVDPILQLQEEGSHASYIPARILGYLSCDDDEHDPLYIDSNRDRVESSKAEGKGDSSKFIVCKPAESAFVHK